MILPNNGKVVIIDDEPEDVAPLVMALTKEKMPFLFFNDRGGNDLPETPMEDVRLIFLDLDLGLGGPSPHEKIRIVQQRIFSIIREKTPYLLVIWSTHEDRYKNELLKGFEDDFRSYRPVAHCSLDKTVIRKPGVDVVGTIRDSLKENLTQFQSFNAFLLWETIVNKSCSEIVDGFTKIFEFDGNWNNNIKAFFYRLAKANVGERKAKELSHSERLILAFETINSALTDSIEKNIRECSEKVELAIEEVNANITAANLIEINTRLHLIHSSHLNHFQPGNIYFPPIPDEKLIEEVVKSTFDKKAYDDIISSQPRVIKVDCTAGCDYAQDKGYTRLLPGVLVEARFKEKKKSTPNYIYDLCPVLNFEKPYYIVFDFRFVKSLRKEMIPEIFGHPNRRFRSQLVLDLQAGISNHINRPGIINVV